MISILYVDDETFLLDVAKAYLEQNNEFQIDTSKSAKEGIEKLKSNNYEAILSDYEMPGMNGIEFLKYVRNSGNTIPFIIFTGHGREEVAIEALNNGADFYIQKGGQPRAQFLELSCKIRQAIERKRIESENKRIISLLSATLESSHDGILADADVYGPSVPKMTGTENEMPMVDESSGKQSIQFSIPVLDGGKAIGSIVIGLSVADLK